MVAKPDNVICLCLCNIFVLNIFYEKILENLWVWRPICHSYCHTGDGLMQVRRDEKMELSNHKKPIRDGESSITRDGSYQILSNPLINLQLNHTVEQLSIS